MDYAAEQEMEIEALEAIFADSLEKYGGTVPDGWQDDALYRITLKPTDEDDQVERKMALDILFAYTSTYPDEAPHIRIQSSYGMSNEEVDEVTKIIGDEVESNIGMAMMFHLFETIKEWLRNQANIDPSMMLTAAERRKLEEEEEEKRIAEQRSHGIPVTVETFTEWRIAFEEEMRRNASKQEQQKDSKLLRLTGKQLFRERAAVFEVEGEEDDEEEEEEDLDYEDDGDEDWADDYLAQNE